MSSQIAISVENVSKKFRLFNTHGARILEALHPFKKKYHREFWALQDVSFDVQRGTTVGIVGKNGSGKSTLLQVVCSVLRPSSGTVAVNGKIASLLELGAGFNPELSGRANVYLKCTLMGLAKAEIKERFPLIEQFADIGEFIDQPVKTYSSGMFVRLAFAAAINVDPDLLVVDEALAVGDVRFQHKCYNKFMDFQRAGRTILFVSHSADAIVRHCDRAILLDNGRVIESGEPKTVMNCYMDLLFTGRSDGYAHVAVLVEEDYKGFNIVYLGLRYYAFALSLGDIDTSRMREGELKKLVDGKTCMAGSSLDEVMKLVDALSAPGSGPAGPVATGTDEREEASEVERFLDEVPATDNCSSRKSYNKNEYRYGDKRAEIIDYLLVCGDKTDPVAINSGQTVDIYMKVLFHRPVQRPMYGFAVKTVDGVIVYGNNTRLSKIQTSPGTEKSIIVVKWSVKMDLNNGDFFINLGVAERLADIDSPIDNRKDIIHVRCSSVDDFVGFSGFETGYQEFVRDMFCSSVADKNLA